MNIEVLKNNNVDVNASLDLWGDMDSYNDGLKEFKESLSTKLSELEKYKNASDLNNYSILAHSIKSESKYLGFMNEAEVFLAHELNGKQNNKEFIDSDFNNLKDTINKIINIINEYFGEPTNKKNIIIADDSNIVLNFLEKSINNEYNLLKASNGNEVLSLISNNDVYAIILDLNMPEMSGFEVLDYLKNHNLINIYPVVIITGDDTEETIKKTFTYPILDVLNKPFSDNNIKRILTSIKEFHENK